MQIRRCVPPPRAAAPDIEAGGHAAGANAAPPTPSGLRGDWEAGAADWTWALRARLGGQADRQAYPRACELRLVTLAHGSRGSSSVRPLAGFLLAGVGKLALGRGTAYLLTGLSDHDATVAAVGGSVAGAGFAASIAIAFGFSRYVAALDPGYAPLVKLASIGATLLLLGGNVLRGLQGHDARIPAAAPICLLAAGFATVTFSLPTFVAHAKLVDGRLRALDGALQAHLFCMAGVGLGIGYAAVSPDPATPGPVGDALIVLATMMLLYGLGLLRTERLLLRAEVCAAGAPGR